MVPTTTDAVADRFSIGPWSNEQARHLMAPAGWTPFPAEEGNLGEPKAKDLEFVTSLPQRLQATESCSSNVLPVVHRQLQEDAISHVGGEKPLSPSGSIEIPKKKAQPPTLDVAPSQNRPTFTSFTKFYLV